MALGRAMAMAMVLVIAKRLWIYTTTQPHIPVLGDRVPPGAQGGIDSRHTPSPNFMGPILRGGGQNYSRIPNLTILGVISYNIPRP